MTARRVAYRSFFFGGVALVTDEIEKLSELAQAALRYADRGWLVHPLKPNGAVDRDGVPADKTPATKNGFKDATCDKSRVKAYWTSNPNANIGISCGRSRLVVLDLDDKGEINGLRSLLQALGYELPKTLTAKTANNGLHLYFEAYPWIEIKSCTNLLPGVDIRAIDGYVVAPPSMATGKPYTWVDENVPIAPLPWELIALTQKVGLCGRNDFLAKVIGPRLRNSNFDEKGLFEEMCKQNTLLFSRHRDGPLPTTEVQKIASSIMRNMDGLKVYSTTDEESGKRLVGKYSTEMRWVWQKKRWYYWGGHRWLIDYDESVAGQRARESADDILDLMKDEEMPPETRKKLFQYYTYLKSVRGWNNALAALKTFPDMCAEATDFDLNPWLLGCLNGTVELRGGVFREGVREDMMTKCCLAMYDPDAKAPRFEQFMREICVRADGTPDPELVNWLWRFLGYCLTGLTTEQCFVFAWGDGKNGKSTLIETFAALLNDYSQTIPVTVLMESGKQFAQGNTPEFAKLHGARIAQSNETREGQAFSAADIKNLTGSDRITAVAKFEHPFTFIPHFKLLLRGNARPSFSAMDEGFKRRLYAVPFLAHFSPGSPGYDPNLQETFIGEMAGILNYFVRGCLEWQKRPLHIDVPASMRDLRAEWIEEQVTFEDFIKDCCELGNSREFHVEPKVLYDTFCLWARNQPGMRMSTKAFRQMMDRYGHGVEGGKMVKVGGKPIRAYLGIRLIGGASSDLSRGDF